MAYVGESLTVWKRSANFTSARYLRPTIRFLWHTPYACQLATYPPSLAHSASPRSEPSIRLRLFVLSSILPSIPLFLSPFSLFLLLPFFFFLDPLLPLLFNGCTRVSDRTPWVHTPAYAWRTACCKTASCARVAYVNICILRFKPSRKTSLRSNEQIRRPALRHTVRFLESFLELESYARRDVVWIFRHVNR